MCAFTPNNPEPAHTFWDDFTTPDLDSAFWNAESTGSIHNNEQQAYINSSQTIYTLQNEPDANGVLALHAHYQPGFRTPRGDTFDFVSGRINTRGKVTFRYGRAEARLKMPQGSGLWPAFWVLGSTGAWPRCGELDIMETVGEPDWLSVAVHGPNYSGETPLVNKRYFQPPTNITGWHTCAVECRPQSLHFFVDDVLVYRVTRPMVEFYGQWVFDDEKFLILNLALGGTYPFKTNGVHQPYYGIPAHTVHTIQNAHARLLVDWVRLTPF